MTAFTVILQIICAAATTVNMILSFRVLRRLKAEPKHRVQWPPRRTARVDVAGETFIVLDFVGYDNATLTGCIVGMVAKVFDEECVGK